MNKLIVGGVVLGASGLIFLSSFLFGDDEEENNVNSGSEKRSSKRLHRKRSSVRSNASYTSSDGSDNDSILSGSISEAPPQNPRRSSK